MKKGKKYQVFLSSTLIDLIEERNAIINCIINIGDIAAGMELFQAADDTQWDVIKKKIDESDYYVLIISDRYGSVDDDGIGYTEKEYDYALSIGKPAIAFVRDHHSIEKLPFDFRESDNKLKLKEFKEKIHKRLFKYWSTREDLTNKFHWAYDDLKEDKPQIGWVRANSKELNVYNVFFYTQDERPSHLLFPNIIEGAKKIRLLVRTGVNLLSQYERNLKEQLVKGCEIEFLCVSDQVAESSPQLYGTGDMFKENFEKIKVHLRRLKNIADSSITLKTIEYAPTLSVMYIEKEDSAFVVVQLYFIYSRIGRDRPMFILQPEDHWFSIFKDEIDFLWEKGVPFNL